MPELVFLSFWHERQRDFKVCNRNGTRGEEYGKDLFRPSAFMMPLFMLSHKTFFIPALFFKFMNSLIPSAVNSSHYHPLEIRSSDAISILGHCLLSMP